MEVRPQVVGVTRSQSWEREFRNLLKPFKEMAVGTALIDNVHDELRLHNSINCWIANDGTKTYRMKYELSLSELRSMTAEEMCNRGEDLAASLKRATEETHPP